MAQSGKRIGRSGWLRFLKTFPTFNYFSRCFHPPDPREKWKRIKVLNLFGFIIRLHHWSFSFFLSVWFLFSISPVSSLSLSVRLSLSLLFALTGRPSSSVIRPIFYYYPTTSLSFSFYLYLFTSSLLTFFSVTLFRSSTCSTWITQIHWWERNASPPKYAASLKND